MRDYARRLTAAAAAVIGLLTGSAFWLSYAHLHTVAAEHGLGGSEARAWAWPGCLDLFIVAGELLMLRASLTRRTDWWAIGLTVVGSGGSIALNIAGVQGSDPLDYVVAAVPPTAALLAFGALMRQVHDTLAGETNVSPTEPWAAGPRSMGQSPMQVGAAGQTALSIAETPADPSKVDIINLAHTPSDQPFSRVRENAPAVGHGRPLTGPVRDGRSLTEGQPVPLSAVRDTASLTEVPVGPLPVGSLGDLTNPDHVGGAAQKGVQTVHTPEVPSAVVTEKVSGIQTPAGDYRIGTPSDAPDAVDLIDGPAPSDSFLSDGGPSGPTGEFSPVPAAADAPHPAASDAASGHPLPAEQGLPEVPSAGRMESVLGPVPWPHLDGASVHPALHPAASAAGQDDRDHSTGAREVITGDVSASDPILGPDAPDALPDADASEAALIATARAVDQAARAETGRAASLRRLQAELRIGQPRAQQLQRILANA